MFVMNKIADSKINHTGLHCMYINNMLLVVPNTEQHCRAVVQWTLSEEGLVIMCHTLLISVSKLRASGHLRSQWQLVQNGGIWTAENTC